MSSIKKVIYVTIGLMAFSLGAIGVILPVLPTTPFLLIASFCFVKGSNRFDKWFKRTKLYKKHLETFVNERAMLLKQKITILLLADIMIAIPFILVDNRMMRVILIATVGLKAYYFFFKIKTIKVKPEVTMNPSDSTS